MLELANVTTHRDCIEPVIVLTYYKINKEQIFANLASVIAVYYI